MYLYSEHCNCFSKRVLVHLISRPQINVFSLKKPLFGMVLDTIKRQIEGQAREGKCVWVKDGSHTCFFARGAIPEYPCVRMIMN